MGYILGVDLGTTSSAAAIGRDGAVEVCALGDRNPSIPSVVVVRPDGSTLVGDAAVRRAREDPTAVAREFKRRLGDDTPLVVGTAALTAEQLTGVLLGAIVEQVRAEQQGDPDLLVLAHPADYGPFKLDILRRVAAGVTPAPVAFVAEPIAAAMKLASESRIEPGTTFAVYDLGGGTFDAAVVRKDAAGFVLVGEPGGTNVGGADFDAAVVAHVDASVDGALGRLDAADPAALRILQRVQAESCIAKESLSHDTDATVEVLLPDGARPVRITRGELESLTRVQLDETLDVLLRTIAGAGLAVTDVDSVLLVGGASRTPLVGQLVAERTGRPVIVDAYPKLAVAVGAAVHGVSGTTPALATEEVAVATPPPDLAAALPAVAPAAARRRPLVPVAIAVALLLAALLGGFLLLGGGGDDDDSVASDGPTTTEEPTTTSSSSTSSSTSSTSSTTTTATTTPTTAAPVATSPPPVVTATTLAVLPEPAGFTVGQGGGSGEVAVDWLADPNPPTVKYQVYRLCLSSGGSIQPDRVVNNVQEEFDAEGHRGFFDVIPCGSDQVCYQVAGVDAFGNEGPRTDQQCF